MTDFLIVSVWLILGAICSQNAKRRGRNPVGWFFIGLVFGLIGLIALFLLPKRLVAGSTSPAHSPMNAKDTEDKLLLTHSKPVSNKFWYYLDGSNNQFGPMSFDALQEAWKENKITLKTYVWNEDLVNWISFEEAQTDIGLIQT